MLGLLVRLVILFAVVFGVAYGATRTLRNRRERKALERGEKAREEILALRGARTEGVVDEREYEKLTREIYESCARDGISIPDLD